MKKIYNGLRGLFLLIGYYRIFDCKVLKGKRIAIIGPADSVFKEKKGNFIDEFDYVVRINKSTLIVEEGNFAEYIGTKTDILFHSFYEHPQSGGGPLDFSLFKRLGIKYVINPMTGYWGLRFSHNFYKKYLRKNRVYRVPIRFYQNLLKKFSPYRPTTGFFSLKLFLDSEFSELYISGFTFFKTPYVDGYRDHVKEVTANQIFIKNEKQHDPDLEFQEFISLLKQHRTKNIQLDEALQSIVGEHFA